MVIFAQVKDFSVISDVLIDLFSLYVLFSQFKSREVYSKELCLTIALLRSYVREFLRNNTSQTPLRPSLEKQNIQA